MGTMMDLRTPAHQIAEAREKARHPLEDLLYWLDDIYRPKWVTDEQLIPVVAAHVGAPVTALEIRQAMDAILARDRHLASTQYTENTFLYLRSLAEDALDVLLDLADCDDCYGLHPVSESKTCAHGTFGIGGTGPTCYTAFHSGNFCPSVDER